MQAQELLVNGGFESGFAGWSVPAYPGSGPYGSQPVAISNTPAGRVVAFNAGDSTPRAQLSQSFATIPGASYTLTFDYGTFYGNWSIPAQTLQVDVSNSSLATQYALSRQHDFTPQFNDLSALSTYSYSFVATSTSSTLTLTDKATNVTYSADGVLDNVSVTSDGPPPDTIAPSIRSVTPSVATLWPANHKMVAVTLAVSASDNVGVTSINIVSVSSSEPDNGLGDGDTAGDVQIGHGLTVNLRAERSGSGFGRTYVIVIEAQDAAGNSSRASGSVFVPKSMGK